MTNKMWKLMNKGEKAGFTKMQMFQMNQIARRHVKRVEAEAAERAFLYMLTIPLNVLVSDYWPKSAKKRAPEFIQKVLSLYEAVEQGVVTDEQLNEFLWEYAGMKVNAEWEKGKEEFQKEGE